MKKILLIFILILISITIFKFKIKNEKLTLNQITINYEEEKNFKLKNLIDLKYEEKIKENKNGNELNNKIFPKKNKITKKELKEDLELLVYILKTRYSFFEKSNINLKLENSIMEILSKYPEKKISVKDIEEDIFKVLSQNINDCHFIFENKQLTKKNHTYIWNGYLNKINDKFFFNNKEILKINNSKDLKKYIVPTIDDNLNLRYTFITLSEIMNYNINLEIEYINNTKEIISLIRVRGSDSPNFEFTLNKDYLYFKLNTFLNIELNGKNLEEYLYDNLKNIKIEDRDLILDLRDNLGGYPASLSYILRRYYDFPFSIYNLMENESSYIKKYHSNYFKNYKKNIENLGVKKGKGKIILIVNNRSMSASEVILYILKVLDYKNIYIFGTNTAGCFISDSGSTFILNNSNLKLSFTQNGQFIPKEYNGEGKGFYPDFWINTDNNNTVKQIILFLKKYK